MPALHVRVSKTKCKTSKKVGYATKVDALMALANIKWKDSTRRSKQEQRAYYHSECKSWHLTSMPAMVDSKVMTP